MGQPPVLVCDVQRAVYVPEVRQLVQVVRHACQCTKAARHTLRHGFLDITVYRQFIDNLGERPSRPLAAAYQFGVIRRSK